MSSKAHGCNPAQKLGKGRQGGSKSSSIVAGISTRQLAELRGRCPHCWVPQSQPCAQGLSVVVTFHMAESYQEERAHPRFLFRSWWFNLSPKSPQQIVHTPNIGLFFFPFVKLKWMHLHFSPKKSSYGTVSWNAGSGWKFMLLKLVVSSVRDIGKTVVLASFWTHA